MARAPKLKPWEHPLRPTLGFAEAVLANFAYLVSEFGLRHVSTETTLLTYESDKVYLNVYHGRLSYEVGVEVGRLSERDTVKPYGLGVLMGLSDEEAGRAYRDPSADKKDEVQRTVAQVAHDFRIYGERALQGDDEVFDRLAVLKDAYWRRYVAGLNKPRQQG